MATADAPNQTIENVESLRSEWLNRLGELIDQLEAWAKEDDWSTRRIEKKMEDSQIGRYRAPALLLQKETARALLEPISHSAPGADGIVELYLMPAYDDIAHLFFYRGTWHLHYTYYGTSEAPMIRKTKPKSLSKKAFQDILEELVKNASS
jgi:hypothetical protein